MNLTETYIVGVLEHIRQEKGKIAIRIFCSRKVKVYDGKRELETSFKANFCDEFNKKGISLSHPIGCFAPGDKVKLSRFWGEDEEDDCFALKNLTLSKNDVCGLDALKPQAPTEELFSIEVKGKLECILSEGGKVALRIKCSEKRYVFFDKNNQRHEKAEVFEKTVFGVIPKDNLRLDLNLETLAIYKNGDEVRLSRTVEEDDTYDFDNLTLSVDYAKSNYKTRIAL